LGKLLGLQPGFPVGCQRCHGIRKQGLLARMSSSSHVLIPPASAGSNRARSTGGRRGVDLALEGRALEGEEGGAGPGGWTGPGGQGGVGRVGREGQGGWALEYTY
jgi:hypothetical protein